jgi:hypothetical protein
VLAVVVAAAVAWPCPAAAGGRRHHGGALLPGKVHRGFQGNTTGGFQGNTTGGLFGMPAEPWRGPRLHHRPRAKVLDGRRATSVPVLPFGFGGSTVVSTVVSSPTTIIYEGAPAPVAASPVIAAAAVPPVPALVEYPEGWYQLQGDGVSVAYHWVWIPRPPPPPVAAVPPTPAAPAPPAGAAPSATPAGPRIGEAYHWTDEEGVTSWTNRPERVPGRYRDPGATPGTPPAPR